ncbi:hypothetical protein IQ06DRAFT_19609 [Phaeosphaeriaceae sp. SRC1lsM3a]|nr:hypothetical protein IQ06DRAFT_19609 [Stagonospora sp. SRC1lsM3a]
MRFHSLPTPLALLALHAIISAPCASAQFTFPPAIERPLSDFISGSATPTLNFSAGDSMWGGWSTPGRLESFMVYRCTGSNEPSATIKPLKSESTFNSSMGRLYPDKTWAYMPLYSSVASGFSNGNNPGSNPIWLHGEFIANNATTGDLCWFELYPGRDGIEPSQEEDGESVRVVYVSGQGRTLDDTGEWYFATEPFKVNPTRPNNMTVTWKSGTPRPDLFKNHTKAYMEEFYSQFPSLKQSSTSSSSTTSGALSVFLQGPGWIGCLALLLAMGL